MLQHVQLFIGIVAREKINLAKYFEGIDEGEDRDKKDSGRQIAQLYGEKLIPFTRAFHIRDLKQFLGDIR